jgi:signal transduction histidine kinase/ActR/RegA family two-component response regulator
MKSIRNLSLNRKLILIVVTSTVLSMFAAAAAIIHFQGNAVRSGMVSELETTADLLGANAAVALRFDSPDDGATILGSLRAKPQVMGACFWRPDGSLFSRYAREAPWAPPPTHLVAGHQFFATGLTLTQMIEHDGDLIGYVHLQSDLSMLEEKRQHAITTTLLSIFTFATIAILACFYLFGIIAQPINSLVRTANKVSETQNYALRAQRYTDDDLGLLTDRFNNMLERIQQREDTLQEIQIELKERVRELAAEKQEVELAHGREQQLQEKLARSRRLESLGVLAGGVAHDLNNILGPLVSYPDLIAKRLPADEKEIQHVLVRMRESARKAAGVIRNLLTLGRRGNINLTPINLNQQLADYFESFDFQALQQRVPHVNLRRELDSDLGVINASSHHLAQVIMNLVINAHEAMRSPGDLLVQSKMVELTEPYVGYQTVEPGRYARLRVEDTGDGISIEKLDRIFEPFFTEKQMGTSGSGLGLAVVYGVMQDLGGLIDVRSTEGKGSCFDLYFPCLKDQPVPDDVPRPSIVGEQRILVVDDLVEQREVATMVLESMGYSVVSAENGKDALSVLDEQSFDLVILDMIMEADFDGLDTYREIIRRNPAQKCIIASGYAESDRVKQALLEGVGAYVAKPYTMDMIGAAVRKGLDRGMAS